MSESSSEAPTLESISRREFVAIAGAAVAAFATGSATAARAATDGPGGGRRNENMLNLSKHPSPNPAFGAWETKDGGVVLWTHRPHSKLVSYRLNANGRRVWRLCDSKRPIDQIADEYNRKTGREKSEARTFLGELTDKSILVAGGFVVLARDFPKALPGGWYRPVINSEDKPM